MESGLHYFLLRQSPNSCPHYTTAGDNLEGFWKGLFGYTYRLILLTAFFENVSQFRLENRAPLEGEKDKNVVNPGRHRPKKC